MFTLLVQVSKQQIVSPGCQSLPMNGKQQQYGPQEAKLLLYGCDDVQTFPASGKVAVGHQDLGLLQRAPR